MGDGPSHAIKRLRRDLKTRILGKNVEWKSTLPSTNDYARNLVESGATNGTLVVADHQSAGHGRLGRIWEVQPGVNLTFSVILRSSLPLERIGLITVAASLAVASTINCECPGLQPTIKWPNDILLGGRKCCGMLLESSARSDGTDPWVVLGIGLNINQSTFPAEMVNTATSLVLEYGQMLDRIALLARILAHLEHWLDRTETDGTGVLEAYEASLAGLNNPVTVTAADDGTSLTGIMRGVEESGALRLETSSGVQIVHAGDVTLRRE